MSRRFLVLCVVLLGSFCASADAQTSKMREIPTRPGATARFLWIAPAQFHTSVIPVVGGDGGLQRASDGSAAWIRETLVG
ncbi:MAG: hypothetical protein HHJ16_15095 [Polaromonas sp.]|uniref:hypothetical protein n=1 Tax=Polaromonas sp. TaxID=1869339 RepID=UPI00183F958D|nr:hypothetical protein [Polaromonas sp.]NMM11585.1 hypothetical protein [Polaromonas sp.]